MARVPCRRRLAAQLALPALLLLPAEGAQASRFAGDLSALLRVHDLVQDPSLPPGVERITSYRPLDTYLRLSWDELGRREAWSVDLALRGRVDLAGGRETQEDLRVLTATASWRSRRALVDLSFGRLRDVVGGGWRSHDGIRLDFRRHRRVKGFVQAGLPVDLAHSGGPDTEGFTWAGGLRFEAPRHGGLGLDYQLRREEGVDVEETLGLDFDWRAGRFSIAGNADYSLPHDRFGETAAAARWRFSKPQVIEARVTRVEPVPGLDTIWAVFTINPYTETRLSWERLEGRVRLGAFVSHERYEETGADRGADIDRAAVTVRFDGPRRARHRGELGWQAGWSGDRLGARWDVDFDLNPRWRLGGGASLNRYQNAYRLSDADEELALRARLSYDHFGRFEIALGLDQYLGRDRDTLRGHLVTRVKLGAARRQRPWWGGPWRGGWAGGAAPREEMQESGAADGAPKSRREGEVTP